jgi:hypothetical protein
VPVLFGRGGAPEKSFDADAYHKAEGLCARGRIPSRINRARFDACRGLWPRLIMIA